MDPLHFCIAVTPLAVYLLLLGILNLRRHPFVTTGARDIAALSIAIIGLMLIGPMRLFFPDAAASRFGATVWLMLVAFYGLCVTLAVLTMRSRIVIYNITPEHLRPILTGAAMRLDKGSRWSGNSLWMPNLKVHLHVESSFWMKNIQLTAGGKEQSFEGWFQLEKELGQSLKKVPVRSNWLGLLMIIGAGVLVVMSTTWMLAEQQTIAKSIDDFLMR